MAGLWKMAEAADQQPEPEPGTGDAAALSIQVSPAAAAAAGDALSPKDRLRQATLKVQHVNRMGEAIRESRERKRPRGMSTMAVPNERQRQNTENKGCCSARPKETDSVRHRDSHRVQHTNCLVHSDRLLLLHAPARADA